MGGARPLLSVSFIASSITCKVPPPFHVILFRSARTNVRGGAVMKYWIDVENGEYGMVRDPDRSARHGG